MTYNWPTAVTLGVDFAHGAGTLPSSPSDLSARLLSLSIRRGRSYELDRVQAGECDLVLLNDDAALDAGNTSSTYNTGGKSILPYRPMQLSATYGGTTYNLFTGYVERWPLTPSTSIATVAPVAVDAFTVLANRRLRPAYIEDYTCNGGWLVPFNDAAGAAAASVYYRNSLGTPAVLVSGPTPGTAAFGATGLISDVGSAWSTTVTSSAHQTGNAWYVSTPSVNPTCRIGGGAAVAASAVTAEVDIWFSTAATSSQPQVLWSQVNTAGTVEFALAIQVTNTLAAYDASTGVGTTQTVNDGAVHHCKLVITGGVATAYLDGTAFGSWTLTAGVAASGYVCVGAQYFNNGSYGLGKNTGYWLSGNGKPVTVACFGLFPTTVPTMDPYSNGVSCWTGETAFSRVNRLMGYAGFSYGANGWAVPGAVNGDVIMPLGPSVGWSGQSALDAAYQAADSAGATVYTRPDGGVMVATRVKRWLETSPAYIFGNGGGSELPYQLGTGFDLDPTYVYNDIEITRTGSATQTLLNSSSATTYGQRSIALTLDLETDSQSLDRAQWIKGSYSGPRRRPTTVVIRPSENAALWPAALGIDIGTRIQVKAHLNTSTADVITVDCFVEGIQHDATPSSWQTTFTVSPVGPAQPLIWDDPTYGKWDSTEVWGF